jgi:hypothetical protein
MAGTKEGGKKASITNKLKYGEDFYKVQGSKGGKAGHTGGFYGRSEFASKCGAIGGRISKRGRAKKKDL